MTSHYATLAKTILLRTILKIKTHQMAIKSEIVDKYNTDKNNNNTSMNVDMLKDHFRYFGMIYLAARFLWK